jgi:transcriptional regulator with XRE-family HTH domain
MLHFLPHVRRDRQLSLDDLGRLVDRDRQTIARLERGERPRDLAIIHRLADALSIDASVLSADSITIYRDGRIEVAK